MNLIQHSVQVQVITVRNYLACLFCTLISSIFVCFPLYIHFASKKTSALAGSLIGNASVDSSPLLRASGKIMLRDIDLKRVPLKM